MSTEIMSWDASMLTMMSKLKKYTAILQRSIAKDSNGLPMKLINPEAVMQTGMVDSAEDLMDQTDLDLFLPITFSEGIPIVGALPIWERLEGEPVDYFSLFKRYRDKTDAKVPRAIFKLSAETGVDVRILETLRQVYNWSVRVQAYDGWLRLERQMAAEARQRELEGRHANAADQLFKASTEYLKAHQDELTPKLALQMLDMSVKLSRMALGLSENPTHGTNAITIQNNIGTSAAVIESAEQTTVTGNVEADKTRVKQLLNIMNSIGVLSPPAEEEVIDVQCEAVD